MGKKGGEDLQSWRQRRDRGRGTRLLARQLRVLFNDDNRRSDCVRKSSGSRSGHKSPPIFHDQCDHEEENEEERLVQMNEVEHDRIERDDSIE